MGHVTHGVRHCGTSQVLWPSAGVVVTETVNRTYHLYHSFFLYLSADLCTVIFNPSICPHRAKAEGCKAKRTIKSIIQVYYS